MNAHPLTVAAALLATALSAQGQRSPAPAVAPGAATTAAVQVGPAVVAQATAGATGTSRATSSATASGTPPGTAANAGLAALDCMIQPHQVVQVGSPAPGVIDDILVDRGDVVLRGQPVVQLNATVERAALAVARERAAQTGDATVASSSRDLAQRELVRAEELHRQQYVSRTYLDKLRSEAGVADGRSDQARERKSLSTREAELAAAQLEQRTVRAPISGVVLERLMSPGEYVDQRPMLRLAAIDPLRVDVLVPASAFGQVSPGMVARVTPELLNRNAQAATVKTVDRVIDAASNTFRVRLELPNPGNTLPAGLRCKVDMARMAMPDAAVPAAPATARAATAHSAAPSLAPVTSTAPAPSLAAAPSAAPATATAASTTAALAGRSPATGAAPAMKAATAAPAAAVKPPAAAAQPATAPPR